MLFLKMNLHRKLVFNWLNRAYLPRTINIQICKKKKKIKKTGKCDHEQKGALWLRGWFLSVYFRLTVLDPAQNMEDARRNLRRSYGSPGRTLKLSEAEHLSPRAQAGATVPAQCQHVVDRLATLDEKANSGFCQTL